MFPLGKNMYICCPLLVILNFRYNRSTEFDCLVDSWLTCGALTAMAWI